MLARVFRARAEVAHVEAGDERVGEMVVGGVERGREAAQRASNRPHGRVWLAADPTDFAWWYGHAGKYLQSRV